jgi:signal transduction histidine kinase
VGAHELIIEMTSGGGESVMGVMAMHSLVLSVEGNGERYHLDTSKKTMRNWKRHDPTTQIGQIVSMDGGIEAMVLMDDQKRNYDAFFRSYALKEKVVHGGMVLKIHSALAYSTGSSFPCYSKVGKVSAGEYELLLQELDIYGNAIGPTKQIIKMTLPLSLHLQAWFRWTMGGLLLFFIFGTILYLVYQNMQIKMAQLKEITAIDEERRRISHDLHDDIGSHLTQIALVSDMAKSKLDDKDAICADLDSIYDEAKSLVRKLDETIWAIRPENDKMEDLVDYICNQSQQFLQAVDIRCRLHLPDDFPDIDMNAQRRHDIYLCVKEAVHNIIKHSGGTQAYLNFEYVAGWLTIMVQDNGGGIVPSERQGNGLRNMEARMKKLNGTYDIKSDPSKGTTVTFKLKMV